ncbi:MAG: hypothetical protein HC924_01365 [Synechococcaceae cyanobacterium SM2_3_2]|nr:hypothetical protein [Synechococcaceae cyanobacterium SM2_3_2]
MKSLEVTVTVSSNGQLSITPPLDIPIGSYKAVLMLDDQPLPSSLSSVANAQAIFRQYVPASRKLSEELIQERRQDAIHE